MFTEKKRSFHLQPCRLTMERLEDRCLLDGGSLSSIAGFPEANLTANRRVNGDAPSQSIAPSFEPSVRRISETGFSIATDSFFVHFSPGRGVDSVFDSAHSMVPVVPAGPDLKSRALTEVRPGT